MLILSSEFGLYDQINASPSRAQNTRELKNCRPKCFNVTMVMNRSIDLCRLNFIPVNILSVLILFYSS